MAEVKLGRQQTQRLWLVASLRTPHLRRFLYGEALSFSGALKKTKTGGISDYHPLLID